jgi:hypothetical protein
LAATEDLAADLLTGGLLELLPAALFAAGFDAEGLAVLFAADFEAALFVVLVFAPCVFFADLAGADFVFAGFVAFAPGFAALAVDFAADFAGAFAAGLSAFFAAGLAAGLATGCASLPPTSARTRPFRLNPDFSGAAALFDFSDFVVLFELTAIPFSCQPWIVLVRPNR